MSEEPKLWKRLFSPYCVSLLALSLSAYTWWDNYFHVKLDVAAGRQVKLWVAKADGGAGIPVILMSLAFTNSGGKTECLQDVKLDVAATSNNRRLWQREFATMREYDTLLATASSIHQGELLPIVIVGKTTETKKCVFCPVDNIQQSEIPKSFDLTMTVSTKHRGSWKSASTYTLKNVSDVWQDLPDVDKWNSSIRDIHEEQ
jgi:hypothetical protein